MTRQGGMFCTVWGTDEYTFGQQVGNNRLNSYSGLDANNGNTATFWNAAYPAINTCNGVIELSN